MLSPLSLKLKVSIHLHSEYFSLKKDGCSVILNTVRDTEG